MYPSCLWPQLEKPKKQVDCGQWTPQFISKFSSRQEQQYYFGLIQLDLFPFCCQTVLIICRPLKSAFHPHYLESHPEAHSKEKILRVVSGPLRTRQPGQSYPRGRTGMPILPCQPEKAADSQARLPAFPIALHGSLLDEYKIEQHKDRTCKQARSLGVWGFVFNQLNIYSGSDSKLLSPHSAAQVSKVVFQCLPHLQKILNLLPFVTSTMYRTIQLFSFGVINCTLHRIFVKLPATPGHVAPSSQKPAQYLFIPSSDTNTGIETTFMELPKSFSSLKIIFFL